MKGKKLDISPFHAAVLQGKRVCASCFHCGETLLSAIGNLLISWLMQQLIDQIGGYDTGFSLAELAGITLLLIAGIAAAFLISCVFRPKFVTRGISQYKAYVFEELMKKNISAFLRENTAAYISGLTNDIQTIENGYLWNTFTVLDSLLTFFGAMVLMLWYSPLLTAAAMLLLSLLPLLASLLTGSKVAKREKKVSDQNEAYTAELRDCLGGFSVIKSFQAEAQMRAIFLGAYQGACRGAVRKTQRMRILVQMFGSVAGITAQPRRVFVRGLAGSVGNRRHGRHNHGLCAAHELCPQPHWHHSHMSCGEESGAGVGGKDGGSPSQSCAGGNGIRSFGDPAGHRC